MRAAALCALILGLGLLILPANVAAQKKVPLAPPVAKEAAKEEEKKEEPFDQKKVDLETIKSAGFASDVKALTDFFRSHTVTEADKARINALIKRTGDESFEVRETTSEEL